MFWTTARNQKSDLLSISDGTDRCVSQINIGCFGVNEILRKMFQFCSGYRILLLERDIMISSNFVQNLDFPSQLVKVSSPEDRPSDLVDACPTDIKIFILDK